MTETDATPVQSHAFDIYEIPMSGYRLHASYFGPRDKTALLLHGGKSSSDQIFPLRLDLAERGIGTLAVDHLGHGRTGGAVEMSSLQGRCEEALEAIRAVDPSCLLGSVSISMGGYVSVKLSSMIQLKALVLIAPAMYDHKAFSEPFDDRFSKVVRRDRSWEHSDAWVILENFSGKVTVIAGKEDEVIPAEVFSKCHSFGPRDRRELVMLDGVGHTVVTSLRDGQEQRLTMVLDRIEACLAGPPAQPS